MATLKITDENFDTEVLKSSKPIVVDFWAEGADLAKWSDRF